MADSKAYVPGYDYDVFISYAHVDDATVGGEPGWVELFHRHLAVQLAKRVGRTDRVRIWRDEALKGNELFDDAIRRRVEGSAVFLALTSTGYLESDYCRSEVRCFHDKAGWEPSGSRIGELSRFLNVLLHNLPDTKWPEEYGKTSGFPFHDAADRDALGQPLLPSETEFQNRLWDLADAIFQTLEALRAAAPTAAPAAPAPAGEPCDVFLAAVADTLKDTRTRLEQELRRRGLTVHKKVPPPYRAGRHHAAAVAALERSALSVHLLDHLPGAEIEDLESESYPREQVRLALEFGRSPILWVPQEMADVTDPEHRDFLEELEHGERHGRSYDFVRGAPLADFAVDVAEKLKRRPKTNGVQTPPASVLLDIQGKDQLFVLDLSQTLIEKQVVPLINPQEKNPRQDEEILRSRLARVGALVIVYGRASAEWVQGRLNQAVNIATSEEFPLKSLCVYLAPPDEGKIDLQRRFPLYRFHLLDNRKGFDPTSLDPLFQDLGVAA